MWRSERRFQERKKIETLNLGKHLLTPNQKVVIREFERKGNGESVKLNRDDEKETVGTEVREEEEVMTGEKNCRLCIPCKNNSKPEREKRMQRE